jgi:hypothetical protein
VGKRESKSLLLRPRHRWEDNIKWIFKKWYRGMDWIRLARDRVKWRALVITVLNLRVPYNKGNFLTRLRTISVSRRTLLHGFSQSVNCDEV